MSRASLDPQECEAIVQDLTDPRRVEPPFVLSEREMLEAWLEFHRTTLLLKCEGVSDEERKRRPVPTSKLSLHGLVRHMAEVERGWFRRVLLEEPSAPPIWRDPAVQDSEMVPLDEADWDADLSTWTAECDRSRAAAAGRELDDTGLKNGMPPTAPSTSSRMRSAWPLWRAYSSIMCT